MTSLTRGGITMKIQATTQQIEKIKTDLVAVLLTKEEADQKTTKTEWEKQVVQAKDFHGESGSSSVLYNIGALTSPRVVLVGLGDQKKCSLEEIRKGAAVAIQTARALNIETMSIVFPHALKSEADVARVLTEGVVLGNYSFSKYKTRDPKDKDLKEVSILADGTTIRAAITNAQTVCANVNMVRDLANENADEATAVNIAQTAARIAKETGIKCTIFDEKKLKSMGMNLICAVNQGSAVPARMVILEYAGDPRSSRKVALVGKGITFDSGGLNLKPTGSIENMKEDMSGAAIVLGTLKTCAELHIRKNVIGILPLTENPIGSRAYKPGDIFKSYAGKTVEIANTDAEGRLILADALAYTTSVMKPDFVVDVATLTGMAQYTFADVVIAMMTNNSVLGQKMRNAGEKTFERVWELPIYEEYKEHVKSDFADLRNSSKSKYAGTITAALFLQEFVNNVPWVHLDIAGVSWGEKNSKYLPMGATGTGMRLLVEFLQS
ncbi:leucyl aminopeptidase [Candidatus Woesearchaeota archaeon]|nr:leucyl aminopeptidase [Candidatus Woesearchaeota archaeon]